MTIEEQLAEATKTNESLVGKLKAANAESAGRRDTINTMQNTIDAKADIDIDKYNQAIDDAGKYSKDKLANQGKIEEIRLEEKKAAEAKYQPVVTALDESEKRHSKRDQSDVYSDIIASAAIHNAVAPRDIAKLIGGNVKVGEDGKRFVVDENNVERLNSKGEKLSVDEYVGEYIGKNPLYAKADGGGSGSQGGSDSGGKPEGSQELIASGLKKLMG